MLVKWVKFSKFSINRCFVDSSRYGWTLGFCLYFCCFFLQNSQQHRDNNHIHRPWCCCHLPHHCCPSMHNNETGLWCSSANWRRKRRNPMPGIAAGGGVATVHTCHPLCCAIASPQPSWATYMAINNPRTFCIRNLKPPLNTERKICHQWSWK